jgi:hypothetical protein
MQLITIPIDKDLVIPENTTKEQWTPEHGRLLVAKRYIGKWLKTSRDYGVKHFGVGYVADTELQMEFQYGIEVKDKDNSINAKDKSRAIVTIEGIHQSFKLWQRKVAEDMQHWELDRLERALKLLEPIELQAKEIRRRIDSGE